jgi:FMN-dependent NADH-azoreductase
MNDNPVLLRIDASARIDGSHTRRLADAAQAIWLARHPQGKVVRRDLALADVPHIDALTIQGFYTPPDQLTGALRAATALSDRLIDELRGAHTLLIASPIYNFGVPSALKAWIDQVVRVGKTFSYDGNAFTGVVRGPRAVLALAYGTPGYQGPTRDHDHLQPYLVQVLNFIGIADVRAAFAEGTVTDPETVERRMQDAEQALAELLDA